MELFKKLSFKKKPVQIKEESKETGNSDTLPEHFSEEGFIEIPLVEVTPTERQISRGTKVRFSGNLKYNRAKLIERIASTELTFEEYQVGSLAKKRVTICYLKNKANPGIVEEIKARIKAIKAETLLDSSYLERNIEDSNFSPFPQVEITERPDVAESALMQGRIVIMLEGSPDILIAPTTFFDLMDTPEDATRRWFVASSFFRLARYIMFIFAVSLPAFYIAFTSYNPELIPTRLLKIVLASQQGTPFPIYFEAFLMMGTVEAIRMLLNRIPGQLGSTIALFSGLALIGAGIAGGIVGIPIVIVVTLTIISSYGIPNIDLRSSVRIIQFFTMIMTSFLGLFGFAAAFFYIAIHLVTLKSFGISYMAPLAPLEASGWGHTILRENSKVMSQDETYKPQTKTKKVKNHHQQKSNGKAIDKLDPRILAAILLVAILEFETFTLGRGVVLAAGEDAWLSILLGGLIVIITSLILIYLANQFPQENFFAYVSKVWGKPLGLLIIFSYLGFWLLFIATLLQDTGTANKFLFLPRTPFFVPLLVISVAAIWLVGYGLTEIVRFFQLLFPFIVIPLALLPFLMFRDINLDNFLPVLSDGFLPVLKGALVYAGAIQGLEIILFIAPFISNPKKMYLPGLLGIVLLIVIDFTTANGGLAIMGVENIKDTIWPGIATVSLIEFPGFPVERFELLLTLPWILGLFTTFCLYLYLISYGIIDMFNFKNRKLIIGVISILILFLVYLFPNFTWTMNVRTILQYGTVVFTLVIPVLTLVLIKIRGKGVVK